ncbi:MAG: 16S rRNA (uracil(1498)-N(3))-methyltransferase [Oscillospiraceae bacterium]|nr:16S rRNA (uracil(1498)-N(3))-methyltransferase [Oscillospiraceae bacterium]
MPRFFMAGTNIKGGMAIIRGRDAEHVRVLRLRPGEDLIICDAQGTDYKCRLVSAEPDKVEAEVIEVVPCPAEPSVAVTVLCGLPKGDGRTISSRNASRREHPRSSFFSPSAASRGPKRPRRSLSASSASPRRPPSSPAAGSSRRCAGRASSPRR